MKLFLIYCLFFISTNSYGNSFFKRLGINSYENEQWEFLSQRGHSNPEVLNRYSNPKGMFERFYGFWDGCTQGTTWENYGVPNKLSFQKPFEDYINSPQFDNLNKSCKKDIVYKYIEQKASLLGDDLFKDEICQNGCPVIKSEVKRIQDAIYYSMGKINSDLEHEILCSQPTIGTAIEKILSGEFDQITKCQEVGEGQYKVVSGWGKDSVNKGGHAYTIVNTSNKYELLFNLDFNADNTSSESKMRQKVNQCLKSVGPNLKTPDGKKLELRFWKNEDGIDKMPPDHQINIVSPLKENGELRRADSGNYPEDISCPTIFHEVLHIAGLRDEYEEHELDYTCRASHDHDSVMNSQASVFNKQNQEVSCQCETQTCQNLLTKKPKIIMSSFIRTTPSDLSAITCSSRGMYSGTIGKLVDLENFDRDIKVLENSSNRFRYSVRDFEISYTENEALVFNNTVSCSCEGSPQECQKEIKIIKKHLLNPEPSRSSCPKGMKEVESILGKSNGKMRIENGLLKIPRRGQLDNLLRPIDYKKLLSGNCNLGLEKFNTCTSYSQISISDPACKNKPSYCDDPSIWTSVEEQ